MELLSPAGNIKSAYAAFKGGADAIYIGGKTFSARASADNFTNEEIKEIVFYAHSIGRKVYVTLNTLIFQDEFFEAVSFAQYLYSLNIDGLIVQDLGLAYYLHKTLPNLPLNASTQLNCHNIKQAKALIDIGFKRIVLAREVNLETVKAIKALGVEVEVFGHGALCVSYSGNCLMSSFIGDRSGNRGRCAQPCRMKYELLENGNKVGDTNFAISTKDLMTIDYINEIKQAGIDSLKLEGRLKSNEYIYLVSKAYRHAIDGLNNYRNNDKSQLVSIFNREFTKGYINNESPFSLLNTKSSSHTGEHLGKVIKAYKNRIAIQLDNTVNRLDGIRFNTSFEFGMNIQKMFLNRESVEKAYKGQVIEISGIDNPERFNGVEVIKTRDTSLINQITNELEMPLKVNIKASFKAKINKEIELTLSFNGTTIKVYGDKPLEATGLGTTKERIAEQLNKAGEYPYYINEIEFNCDKCFIPISAINKLKNEAYEKLISSLNKINEVNPLEYISEDFNLINIINCSKALVETIEQQNSCEEMGINAYSYFDNYYIKENRVTNKNSFNSENELVNFIIKKENNGDLIASQYCNITNSYALDCYYKFGFNECILSVELDYSSIKSLIDDYKNRHNTLPNVGVIIYGKMDMMIMKSCPIGTCFKNKSTHCNRCHLKNYELKDRTGVKYKLLGDSDCNVRVLSDKPICLFNNINELQDIGVSVGYLVLTDESDKKATEVIDCMFNNTNVKNSTLGHYKRRPL